MYTYYYTIYINVYNTHMSYTEQIYFNARHYFFFFFVNNFTLYLHIVTILYTRILNKKYKNELNN